jgi:1-aminocyclopropane-1-carboxylate deaminase/D-cysteine desulfhydrase-like pyridoxal-dependent ACC family enzyme
MAEHSPPLFEAYPGLHERVPWIHLATLPTPVQRLSRLGEAVHVENLYVKCDDLTSSLYGGNKLRKLEFLLAEAKRRKARTVVTVGGVGSNHALATTIYGRQLGFRIVLVLVDQPVARYVRQNLLLDHYHGAKLVTTSKSTFPLRVLYHRLAGTDWRHLRLSFHIPFGGSTPLGCLGFVNAAFELRRQVQEGVLPEPDYVFVAVGTMGTASGLSLGFKLAGLKTQVVGVRVAPRSMANPEKWARLMNRSSCLLSGKDPSIPGVEVTQNELILLEDFFGGRYAQFTRKGMEAVRLMEERESIHLDGTYTGKALAGALDYIGRNQLERKVLLFWNTYNSADLSSLARGLDYRRLPKAVHRYFRLPCQELDVG